MTQTSVSKVFELRAYADGPYYGYCRVGYFSSVEKGREAYYDYCDENLLINPSYALVLIEIDERLNKKRQKPTEEYVSDPDRKPLGSRHRSRRVAKRGDTDMVRDLD